MRGWETKICTQILDTNFGYRSRDIVHAHCAMMICTRQALWSRISRKRLEIEARFQWSTNRKSPMENWIVMWPMTSCDLEKSRLQRSTHRKWYIGIKWSHARWCHVTPKGKGRDTDVFGAEYLENSRNRGCVPIEHQQEIVYGELNHHLSDDVTRPWKVKVVTPICEN